MHRTPLILVAALTSLLAALASSQTRGPVADNSVCHVCHINYASEELAVNHANNNIGCVQCHGFSQAHADDEENTTPPDRMWPKDEIVASCQDECHESAKIQETHEPVWTAPADKKKLCTDCHGKHRIETRTTRWDRKTGEVIE